MAKIIFSQTSEKFGQIIEGLYIDCKSDEDYDLIDRFFGN